MSESAKTILEIVRWWGDISCGLYVLAWALSSCLHASGDVASEPVGEWRAFGKTAWGMAFVAIWLLWARDYVVAAAA